MEPGERAWSTDGAARFTCIGAPSAGTPDFRVSCPEREAAMRHKTEVSTTIATVMLIVLGLAVVVGVYVWITG